MQSILMSALVLGIVVISTPSGQSTIVLTNGAASHVTSGYSAQIDSTVALPGEHVTVTPVGTVTAKSSGQTATVTVVSK